MKPLDVGRLEALGFFIADDLLEPNGPPPRVRWVTCGNVSNFALQRLFAAAWERVAAEFASSEVLVELAGRD